MPQETPAATAATRSNESQVMPVPQALKLAAQQIDHGQLAPAEGILRQILHKLPGNPEALHLMGVLAHRAGKTAAAIELIGQAIAGQPETAHFHANRGEMLRLSKRLDEAILHGDLAVSLAPDMAVYHSNLGIACYDKKDYARAEACQKKALSIDPGLPNALNNLGSIRRELKDKEEAVSYYRRALQFAPGYLEAMNNLGAVLVELEKPDEAIPMLLGVLRAQPEHADAHNNLANAMLLREEFDKALFGYRKALATQPEHPDALLGLARALLHDDQTEPALAAGRHALAAMPDKAAVHTLLGDALTKLERYDEAREAYDRALVLDENLLSAHLGLGQLQMELGQMAAAEASFSRAMNIDPSDISPHIQMIHVRKIRPGDASLARLESEAGQIGSLFERKAMALHFALGKAYDDLKTYDQAFPHFAAGCRIKRKYVAYDADQQDALIQRICDAFSPATVDRLRGGGDSSDLPIFVLGMPRSGTTLVETIIASHPEVHGAGELRDLLVLAGEPLGTDQSEVFPESLRRLERADLARLGARYVAGLRQRSPAARHITDKMPANFLALGLIHLILPRARIIHVKRNAADICLSGFTKCFGHGQYHSYDLREMGRYYAGYARLMDHWRQVLPAEAFLEVQYESLVSDKEAQTRRLIDYCGLVWDDACLRSHESERSVKTASITQVRQPVYTSSVERWRHYETFLRPLFGALGPHAPQGVVLQE